MNEIERIMNINRNIKNKRKRKLLQKNSNCFSLFLC